jgi:hypothetical protein
VCHRPAATGGAGGRLQATAAGLPKRCTCWRAKPAPAGKPEGANQPKPRCADRPGLSPRSCCRGIRESSSWTKLPTALNGVYPSSNYPSGIQPIGIGRKNRPGPSDWASCLVSIVVQVLPGHTCTAWSFQLIQKSDELPQPKPLIQFP